MMDTPVLVTLEDPRVADLEGAQGSSLNPLPVFKGDGNPDDNYVFIWNILINHGFWYQFHLNRFKMCKLWAFEYLQMDCNGSGQFVGLVTSHSLIKYA